jgi:hypothetical protein
MGTASLALAVTAPAAAGAAPPPETGGGSQGNGAMVLHCNGVPFFGRGVIVFTPSGNVLGGRQCFPAPSLASA